ncbi:MAG: Kdo hydroxylase family protein [Gammaproteobacteria bacterium]|nr:Kdo hydroxylase family protein [Gammaproteobacteria bacterium]
MTLQTFSTHHWDANFNQSSQHMAMNSLESGQILFLPHLAFNINESECRFLSPEYVDPHAKNISFHALQNKLWGVQHLSDPQHIQLKQMLGRFAQNALKLIQELLPRYAEEMIMARTSFRPVEISNRKTSYRKDDKRLHIDAFPSAPNQGKRILRVFTNINPDRVDRVWRVGESFERVAQQFLPKIKKPIPGCATTLRFLKITKSFRTPYDHYMLHMHDKMKADEAYQQRAQQQTIRFPTGSTWIVQTDQVSHAAMLGQHVLEQTFYLPISAMQDENRSPLRILEKMLQQRLV